jgi:hypothetical protein
MQLQRFENTFFNMLNLQQEIVSNLQFNSATSLKSKVKVESREIFEVMFKRSSIIDKLRVHIGIKEIIESHGVEGYAKIEEIALFDHYFRHLYRIIKFVDESSLEKKEKFQYLGVLRATLSRYELIFLFYNGLIHKKCKELIERYSLLQNMVEIELPLHDDENYVSEYKPSAFSNDIDA